MTGTFWWLLSIAGFGALGWWASRRGTFTGWEKELPRFSTLTLLASILATSLGTWVLVGPAESVPWGGIPVLLAYALGCALPLWLFIPLSSKLQKSFPGRGFPGFIQENLPPSFRRVTLVTMAAYLFFAITAELTAIARILQLLSGWPLYLGAILIMPPTLFYVLKGGLSASVITDRLQSFFLIPLLITAGILLLTDPQTAPTLANQLNNPSLGQNFLSQGWTMLGFILSITAAILLDQSFWQRARLANTPSSRWIGFGCGGFIVGAIVLMVGTSALVTTESPENLPADMALFYRLAEGIPSALLPILGFLAICLVMSSIDSGLAGLREIIEQPSPNQSPSPRSSFQQKSLLIGLASLATIFASMGWSVLYLFMIANLFCASLLIPCVRRLFQAQHQPHIPEAIQIPLALTAAAAVFPPPDFSAGNLGLAFLLSLAIPTILGWPGKTIKASHP